MRKLWKIRIIIGLNGIKFKNNMEKVYVLVCDSMTRGEQEINVKTFSSKAKAEAEMEKCYDAELNDWKSWCDNECLETQKGKNSLGIWETGNYHENHIEWTIYEQKVL